MERKSVYDNFANSIIEQLKNGTAPWVKPWEAGEFISPFNPITGKNYNGANILALAKHSYADPRWQTLIQSNKQEKRVKKGEKATQIMYWQFHKNEKIRDEHGQPVLDEAGNYKFETAALDRPIFKAAYVFNGSQIEGIEPFKQEERERTWDTIERAEKIIKNSGAVISHDTIDRACYIPSADKIRMPAQDQFPDQANYYSVMIHELAHWTGAENRLNRTAFGKEEYAREELRAEIAAWLICMDLVLPYNPDQHLSYVASWIKALENDPYEIVRATRDAEKIKDMILGMEHEVYKETVQVQAVETEANKNLTPEKEADKIFLNVPYNEKNQAKALGARWDKTERSWYISSKQDIEKFEAWTGTKEKPLPTLSPEAEFAKRLRDAGLVIDGLPIMDGQFHRVPIEGRPKAKDGVYRGNLDGIPAGWFQNHVTGEKENWKYSSHSLSSEQIVNLKTEAKEKSVQEGQDRKYVHEQGAKRCFGIFENAHEADKNHSYLKNKAVSAIGIKQDKHGNLLIPGRDVNGHIQTLQTITPEGEKFFAKNTQKTGAFHIIDPNNEFKNMENIFIAEGYATASSINKVLRHPVVCAFDASNLVHVANALHEKYPDGKIIILADNDHHLTHNVGVEKACLAADAVGGKVYVPEFSAEEKKLGLKDWNDLTNKLGVKAVTPLLYKEPFYIGKTKEQSCEQEKEQKKSEDRGLEL